ncbi:hypothetical protein [Ruegeria sp. HKCCD8929]|uniref:hypothetical protein n=1 Tax=Ruegeria sp. HKCCD8929 TaxID=2683006 RepID=UPI0014899EA3|nr:hypothetical protein [Ruegeria sp. HKCCD8929]
MGNGNKSDKFSAEEIAEIIGNDVQNMISNLGAFDPGDPQQVYEDTKRIMDKLSDGTAERAKKVAEDREK